MALNPQALSKLMQTNLAPVIGASTPTQQAQLKGFCDGLSQAIVTHVLTAVVAGTVTTGQGAGGVVTGTIT